MHESFFPKKIEFDYMCFIIWSHGISYLPEIISDLEDDNDFEILMAKNISNFDPKQFILRVYGCDTYPLKHLQSKISYLLKLPQKCTFIFVKCFATVKNSVGSGLFRNLQSQKMVLFKQQFRNKYNPRDKSGKITHDHIIHGTDYESQTDYLLKLIGYSEGLKIFERNSPFFVPHHLQWTGAYKIKTVEIDTLRANILHFQEGKVYTKLCRLTETPHFVGIHSPSIYEKYLTEFQYTYLCDFYSIKKFSNLQHRDIKKIITTTPILTQEVTEGIYTICDGVHRAAIAKYKGVSNLPVVIMQ